MATDAGITGRLEAWIISLLAALTSGGKDVFKEVDHWRSQIADDNSGLASFGRFAPFAFVAYQDCDGRREGDHDLRQELLFAVTFGQKSREAGICRIGDANNLGTSRMRELIIDALDHTHPGDGFGCDDLHYLREETYINAAKMNGIQMWFKIDWLKTG